MKRLWLALSFVLLFGLEAWAVPGPPTNLTAQVSGTTVILAWVGPAGVTVIGFRIQAGTAPGLSNVANLVVGTAPGLTAPNVPNGTYYVRVIAIAADGESLASNEVTVVVGGGGPGPCVVPAAPGNLVVTVSGSTVTVTWTPVAGAGIVYVLEVGSQPGLTDIIVLEVGANPSLSANAPNGVYNIRVRARSSCGLGPPSANAVANVGGGGGAPPPSGDWLAILNAWRAHAGLGPVTENPTYSAGDLLHARYSVKNNNLIHDEDTTNPWYTPEGRAAAMASNGSANNSSSAPDSYAIESWVQAPFHAAGMFSRRLVTSGYGAYREVKPGYQMSGWLDVIRGATGPSTGPTVLFPANGATIPIPNREICPAGTACFWGESPSPLTSCPGYTTPAGLPLLMMMAPNTTPTVTSSSLMRAGVPLEHCVFTGATYVHPDPAQQTSQRSSLRIRGVVVIVPRSPLPANSTYNVSVSADGSTTQWSFTIAAGAARTGPVPEWAKNPIPPALVYPRGTKETRRTKNEE